MDKIKCKLVICNKNFIPNDSRQKYCSFKCYEKSYYWRHKDEVLFKQQNQRVGRNVKCHNCDKIFDTKHSTKLSCSKACEKNRRRNQRNQIKQFAVSLLGGKCCECGYCKCVAALEFHHKDPSKKEFNISRLYDEPDSDLILSEVKKCILLCSNCHRELHFYERR